MTPLTIRDTSQIVLPKQYDCPICGKPIFIEEVTDWIEDDEGNMKAEAVKIECSTFPGFDDIDEFNAFMRGHWSMPYVDWLPLEKIVTDWVNQNYNWEKSQ